MSKKAQIRFERYMQVLAQVQETGAALVLEPKKGWLKVEGPKGAKVYIAQQEVPGRIDLSGFSVDGCFVPIDPDKPNGAVTGHIDLTRSEEEVLEGFRNALLRLADAEYVRKSPRKGSSSSSGRRLTKEEVASQIEALGLAADRS